MHSGTQWTRWPSAAALIGIGLLAAGPLHAQLPPSHDVKISGTGTARCSEWSAWKVDGNAERRNVALQWVSGFLAGHNVYSVRAHRSSPALNPQANAMETLLDGYCEKNPSARLVEAAVEMITGLGGANAGIKPAKPQQTPAAPVLRQQAL